MSYEPLNKRFNPHQKLTPRFLMDNYSDSAIRQQLQQGFDVNRKDHFGNTVLFYAMKRSVDVVRAVIDAGANVNTSEGSGYTPLMWSIGNNRAPVVQLLIDRGANMNSINMYGQTALTMAAIRGYTEMARVLLEAGAQTHHKDRSGRTALDWAKAGSNDELVALLRAREDRTEMFAKLNARAPRLRISP